MAAIDLKTQFKQHSLTLGVLAVAFAITLTGCTLCQDCGDLDYPTYGGAWQRTRRDSGRVGSLFDPAGARTATLSDRDSGREDELTRNSAARVGSGVAGESEDDRPRYPRDVFRSQEPDERAPSPSDRPRDGSPLRDLNLEDIDVPRADLLPPDV